MFQSLIGKLEAHDADTVRLPLCPFQSLIGKLEAKHVSGAKRV